MRRFSLRARLGLLVLAAVLPMLALNLLTILVDYRAERARAERQALSLAHTVALAVENELRARIGVLEVLALSPALAAGAFDGFRAEAEAVLARQSPGAAILLLREDGAVVMNTAVPRGTAAPPRLGDNHRSVFATGRPAVSDLFLSAAEQRPTIAIDVPVRGPDGAVRLVVALNPTLDAFDAELRRQSPGPGWRLSLFDRAGRRIARVPDGAALVGTTIIPEVLRPWSRGESEASMLATGVDGLRTLTAFSRLSETGWGAAVAVPADQVTGPAVRNALASLVGGLVLLTVGLLLAQRIAGGVVRPMQRLLRVATEAENGGAAEAGAGTLGLPEADALAAAYLAEARKRRAATAAVIDSERRLRLVVAELNHRAKNALATVQALALQTARGADGLSPERFTEAFTARLQTLARAHDLLTAMSWEGAALGAVVRAGLAPWLGAAEGGGASPRFVLHCPCDLALPPTAPGQVQALIMAMHELAVNAMKHGALSVPGGRVEITCGADPAGTEAALEWRETGGPPVPGPPTRRGFGTRLLERALVHDLGPGARVSLEFRPEGLRAAIRYAPRAAERAALNPAA